MHHESASEIEHTFLRQPTSAPDPMRHGHVDDHKPERGEQQHGAEAHALGKGADDQRGRDDGEGHLKHEEDGLGDGGVRPCGLARNAAQQHLLQIPKPGPSTAKGQAIGEGEPHHRHHAGNGETLH
jgi:hypothetical protein